MRPKLNRASVLKALRQFDTDLRNTPEWARWEENASHKYALLHDGHCYPVKKIAWLASGIPMSEFSGGEYAGHANRLIEAVVSKSCDVAAPIRIGFGMS